MTRNEIIEALIPQIRCWVRSYTAKRPEVASLYDDLLGDAYLKLMHRLSLFSDPILDHFDGKFDKLSTYIRLSTWTSMADTVRKTPIITEPHSRAERISCEPLSYHPMAREVDPDQLQDEDVLKRLFEITQDKWDVKILHAKLNGAKTAQAVSTLIGLSTTTIYRRLRILRNRYHHE